MLASIEEAIDALKAGKMIILVDDVDRENEGDLCMLSECVTPDDINFMVTHARGLVCVTMTQERLDELAIPPMTSNNTSRFHTAFHVSIEAAQGVTTGISAADRAHTIRTAAAPDCRPEDLARPGHIFPISARPGGSLVRIGQTEGSVDLAKLANARVPSAVICEIMKDDGSMARMPDLEIFAQIHDLPIVTIADLVAYRLRSESLVERCHSEKLSKGIAQGFTAHVFKNKIDKSMHLALTLGWDESGTTTPLVRVHSGALWIDALALDESGKSLSSAIEQIRQNGCGILLYIANGKSDVQGAFQGLMPDHDDDAKNRIAPDTRLYGIGAQCLRMLNVTEMALLTDTPKNFTALDGFGLKIVKSCSMSHH